MLLRVWNVWGGAGNTAGYMTERYETKLHVVERHSSILTITLTYSLAPYITSSLVRARCSNLRVWYKRGRERRTD